MSIDFWLGLISGIISMILIWIMIEFDKGIDKMSSYEVNKK